MITVSAFYMYCTPVLWLFMVYFHSYPLIVCSNYSSCYNVYI